MPTRQNAHAMVMTGHDAESPRIRQLPICRTATRNRRR